MVESGIRPRGRVVTDLAGGREAGMRHRARGIVEIDLVTMNAEGSGDVVIAELRVVAICAGARRHGVHTRQLEAFIRVVEHRIGPSNRVVATVTGRGKTSVRNRAGRTVEIRLVAINAGRRGDVVIAKLRIVAIRAGARWICVRICQRESRRVSKCRPQPGRGAVMALCAVGRVIRLRVIRVGRAVVIRLMTENAGCRRNVVIAELRVVAIAAQPWRHRVHVGQRECRRMVERGAQPAAGAAMTLRAVGREVRLCVIGIGRAVVVRLMTENAGRGRDVVIAKLRVVAIGAGTRRHSVHARQRESGAVVIERRIEPR